MFQQYLHEFNKKSIPLVSVVVFFCLIFFQQGIVQDFLNSADEFNYYYQATLFASGNISTQAHPLQEALSPFYIIEHNSRAFSIFPPGWPLILAIGVKLGIGHLINPLLASLTVVLLFIITKHRKSPGIAWLAVILFVISPFFVFNSASYFAHPTCLFWVCLTWLLIMLGNDRNQYFYFCLAGIAAAMAFSTRELTAVALLTLPICWAIIRQHHKFAPFGHFVLGAFPIVLLYLVYNASLVGEWFVPLRFLQESERYGFGERVVRVFDYVETQYFGFEQANHFLAQNLVGLFSWTFCGLPLMALLGMWSQRRSVFDQILVLSMLLLIVAYYFYPTSAGNNQYGPRFYYEMLAFMAYFAAVGVGYVYHTMQMNLRSVLFVVLGLGIISLFNLSLIAVSISEQIYERRTLERFIDRRGLSNALVFVASQSGDMFEGDLIRNLPNLQNAEVIYAWNLGSANQQIQEAFPQREVYIFKKNQSTNTYSLTRLHSTLGEAK